MDRLQTRLENLQSTQSAGPTAQPQSSDAAYDPLELLKNATASENEVSENELGE